MIGERFGSCRGCESDQTVLSVLVESRKHQTHVSTITERRCRAKIINFRTSILPRSHSVCDLELPELLQPSNSRNLQELFMIVHKSTGAVLTHRYTKIFPPRDWCRIQSLPSNPGQEQTHRHTERMMMMRMIWQHNKLNLRLSGCSERLDLTLVFVAILFFNLFVSVSCFC